MSIGRVVQRSKQCLPTAVKNRQNKRIILHSRRRIQRMKKMDTTVQRCILRIKNTQAVEERQLVKNIKAMTTLALSKKAMTCMWKEMTKSFLFSILIDTRGEPTTFVQIVISLSDLIFM